MGDQFQDVTLFLIDLDWFSYDEIPFAIKTRSCGNFGRDGEDYLATNLAHFERNNGTTAQFIKTVTRTETLIARQLPVVK